MEGEGRFRGLGGFPASQSAWSGPVEQLIKAKAAVEEFSSNSSVSQHVFKRKELPPRYVWSAVLSVSAALMIALMLRKCFHTLSQAADSKRPEFMLQGSAGARRLSEGKPGHCDPKALLPGGHQVISEDGGDGGDPETLVGQAGSVDANGEGSGGETPSESAPEVFTNPMVYGPWQDVPGSGGFSFSELLRWLCCGFSCGTWLSLRSPPEFVAGVSPEVGGFFGWRPSYDGDGDPWQGALPVKSGGKTDEGSRTDGVSTSEACLTSSEGTWDDDQGGPESDDETGSAGGSVVILIESEDGGDDTESMITISLTDEDGGEAGKTGAKGGGKEEKPAGKAGSDVEGSAAKGGRPRRYERTPHNPSSSHRMGAAQSASWRLILQRVGEFAGSGMSDERSENGQGEETAEGNDGTQPSNPKV
ncbi:hypothetical protein ACSSS7_004818 [Eimeria intestinalis]